MAQAVGSSATHSKAKAFLSTWCHGGHYKFACSRTPHPHMSSQVHLPLLIRHSHSTRPQLLNLSSDRRIRRHHRHGGMPW